MKGMHKKSKFVLLGLAGIAGIISIIICLAPGISTHEGHEAEPVKYYTFTEVSECEKLMFLGDNGASFESYEAPLNDVYLDDLIFSDFFAGKYTSWTSDFEIYAYEFATPEVSKQYLHNCIGYDDQFHVWVSDKDSGIKWHIIVMDHERVYAVYTSRSDVEEVRQILKSVFEKEIDLREAIINELVEPDT